MMYNIFDDILDAGVENAYLFMDLKFWVIESNISSY